MLPFSDAYRQRFLDTELTISFSLSWNFSFARPGAHATKPKIASYSDYAAGGYELKIPFL